MGVVNYYGTDGEILGDSQAGDYLRDALGSVTATSSPTTGAVQNTYRYKPYGSQLTSSGASSTPKFQWVGTAGYRETSISHSQSYVRARHYGQQAGRWTTVDPTWIVKSSYTYCLSSPNILTDPSGLDPISLRLNAFLGKRLGRWLPEPPSMNLIGGSRYEFLGDYRDFGEEGSSRIGTQFTIDSCSVGSSGMFRNNTGTSHRRIIGGDGTVETKASFNWLNIKLSGGAGKCITYFHGEVMSAYPFIRPMIAPTTVSLEGYIYVAGKNQIGVYGLIKHSPFPDTELIGLIGPFKTTLYTYKTSFSGLILTIPLMIEEKFSYFLKAPTDCCCTEIPCCKGECPCI